MDPKYMNLKDFVSFMRRELGEFEERWRRNQQDNPTEWSEDCMRLVDWLEQLEMMSGD